MLKTYRRKSRAAKMEEKKIDKLMFSYIKQFKPATILEVGCGFSYTLRKIAMKFPHSKVYGCDFSSKLIHLAKEYAKGYIDKSRLRTAEATKIGSIYRNEGFDLIITGGCLMCLKSSQVKKALIEFKKLANRFLLIESDYSHMGFLEKLRFREERNYPINNYREIIQSIDKLKVTKVDETFSKEKLTPYLTFFVVEVLP
jgi:ubiquinone/menaquinone biosynthesis C-methylase UbiE